MAWTMSADDATWLQSLESDTYQCECQYCEEMWESRIYGADTCPRCEMELESEAIADAEEMEQLYYDAIRL